MSRMAVKRMLKQPMGILRQFYRGCLAAPEKVQDTATSLFVAALLVACYSMVLHEILENVIQLFRHPGKMNRSRTGSASMASSPVSSRTSRTRRFSRGDEGNGTVDMGVSYSSQRITPIAGSAPRISYRRGD